MPAVDTVLLPLCVGLTLLGVIATGIAWRKGNKGRVIQGAGLALAPLALFFSGLLRLLWNGVVAVVDWTSKIIFSPGVWFGLSLLALCIVLWVVGGFVHRKFTPDADTRKKDAKVAGAGQDKAVTRGKTPQKGQAATTQKGQPAQKGQAQQKADPVDDEMAEIEALLKSRGIE